MICLACFKIFDFLELLAGRVLQVRAMKSQNFPSHYGDGILGLAVGEEGGGKGRKCSSFFSVLKRWSLSFHYLSVKGSYSSSKNLIVLLMM